MYLIVYGLFMSIISQLIYQQLQSKCIILQWIIINLNLKSKRKYEEQDVFVPWHLNPPKKNKPKKQQFRKNVWFFLNNFTKLFNQLIK